MHAINVALINAIKDLEEQNNIYRAETSLTIEQLQQEIELLKSK